MPGIMMNGVPFHEALFRTPRAAKHALDTLFRENHPSFAKLFLGERSVRVSRPIAEPLLRAGIIVASDGGYAGTVRIWRQRELYLMSDRFTYRHSNRVYPVYLDQGAFFAEHLPVVAADAVLDIGTGSGVLALSCAPVARSTLAIDTNPRAIAFARANAVLNGLEDSVRFRTRSFERSLGRRFSLVICNPPFTAVPESNAWFHHGSSGMDGHDFFRRLLANLSSLLTHSNRSRAQILINSFGTDTEIQAVTLLREQFPDAHLTLRHPFHPPSVPIEHYLRRFRASPAYETWRAWVKSRGFTRVYRPLITVAPRGGAGVTTHYGGGFRIDLLEPFGRRPILCRRAYRSGGWSEMLLRYGARTVAAPTRDTRLARGMLTHR